MRGGQNVRIPILGINNQLLDDQSRDGYCDSIVNLKPKGHTDQPYWVPFERIEALRNEALADFSYEFGMSSITDAFWQVRNFAGEFSEDLDGSLKRLLVLCQNASRKCIDIIEPDTWAIVKTQALPQEGTYTWSCTRLDEITVIVLNRDKKPYLLYYLKDDTFIPQGWPDMPLITFSTATETISEPDITAGNTKGVMRKATDQWFMATWAFRLNDGTHVKQNAPILVKVDAGDTDEAVKPVFTLDGYTEIENLLIEQPFWKVLIAGISVCCTIPRDAEKTALDDGLFYEVGYWPWIDKLPEDQWPTATDPNILTIETKSDNWPTGRNLGIDNFTHHKYSSRVVDTYNKRLLLGGRSVDFAIPKLITNGSQTTVPGGVYTDYLDFEGGLFEVTNLYFDASGSAVGTVDDPNYNYETNLRTYESLFDPKPGREFMAVSILESNPGDADVNPPGGPTGMPSAAYTAAFNMSGQLQLEIDLEETNFGSGGQFGGSDSPYMRVRLEIGPTGGVTDQVVIFTVTPVGSTPPYVGFSDIVLEADSGTPGAGIYHRVTIKTDSGTYYRILTQNLGDAGTEVTLPEVIWYPDRRATLYELIVNNGGVYEVALSKQLTQHPASNYSYAILSTGEQTYTLGDSLATTTEPDLSVNDVFQYVPNLIQASVSGNPFIFDSAASYRVGNRENEIILGFGVNINKTNEGQAGQFPVYAFSDSGIWALEQTGDPTIAFGKITPISNFNGINNPYALTNAGQLIVCTDNKYIYALAGMEVRRIDEEIANDPDYADYLKQVRIGYHRANDYEEVIFSNPFYDYSLCYNLKYGAWYKATERFKFFFYDYPELMGMTVDNVLKDFSRKNTEQPVAWSVSTRPWNLGEPYELKRLFPTYLRMGMQQPLQENAADYLPVRVQLKGYRDSPNMVYNLKDETYKTDKLGNVRIYNQNGSFYAYRVILNGTNNNKNGFFQEFDGFFEKRYLETRRRLDCTAQYLYANGDASISICNCSDGEGGTDAYFAYTGTATDNVVVTHGLNKIPSVFVTDLDGYLIECGVQLIITEGQPSNTQIRLTFDDPIPFKAYFN